MRRRDFIESIALGTVAWPAAARAQQPAKIPRVGIIDEAPMWNAFREGLRDLGYRKVGTSPSTIATPMACPNGSPRLRLNSSACPSM